MTSTSSDVDQVDVKDILVTERELWDQGPPHEVFTRLRNECPVHWTSKLSEFPTEKGYWSITRAEDIHTVSRDFRTYSSELGGVTAATVGFPIELSRAMSTGMDPPKHDRLNTLFQATLPPNRTPPP